MLSHEEILQDLQSLKEITLRHKAAGAELAVTTATINGIETPVFSKVPDNLERIYRIAAEQHPQLPFLIYQEQRYSFGEAYAMAGQLAMALTQQFAIEKGDRVTVCSRNNPEWCLAYMAITMLGAIVVPMNSWWRGSEMMFGLQDSGSKLIFADQERIDRLSPLMAQIDAKIIAIKPAPQSPYPEIHALIEAAAQGPNFDPAAHPVAPDDDASILYTSGSTGHPKGVLSTHRAIINAIYTWKFAKEINEILRPELREENPQYQPGILANVPLFHVTGNHAQFLSSFLYQRKFVMMYKWDAEQALQLIEAERLSVLHGVPTMTWEVMNSPNFDKFDLSSLRSVQSGGSARPPEHLLMMQKKFSPQALPGLGYGLTETNAIGALITGKFYLSKPHSTGRPTPPVTAMRIEDAQGRELPNGEIGEICIKGATIMKGYWKRPEDTAAAIVDGWFHTGDIGLLDEHGFLVIKDRAKDIVIRGGENIACAEIEYALAEHPAVCEAAVFGLPDDRLGEVVGAVVMTMPGATLSEEELGIFLAERLAQFKLPYFYRIQSEQLQRIASGKIAKKLIREEVIASLSTPIPS
jgi:long-chain acyl-CoA synthetase